MSSHVSTVLPSLSTGAPIRNRSVSATTGRAMSDGLPFEGAVRTARIAPYVSRLFFPAAITGAVVLLATLGFLASTKLLIQGSYVLVGLLLGSAVYYKRPHETAAGTPNRRLRRLATKGVVIVLALSVTVTFLAGDRTLTLFVGLPLSYALLATQYLHDQSPERLVPQIAIVFALGPLTKYLTTGFYWGAGDLIRREAEIRQLLAAGRTGAIDGLYELFSGLHLLVASTSLVGGLPSHDGLLVAGLVAYTSLIGVSYVIARQVTGDTTLAIAITLAVSFLQPIHRMASYFFSQSFAFVLLMFLLYLGFKRTESRSYVMDLAALVVIFAFVVTHHLSLLLLGPLVIVLLVVGIVNSEDVVRLNRFAAPFVLLTVITVAYWAYRDWAYWFFVQLIVAVVALATQFQSFLPTAAAAADEATALTFGTTAPVETAQSILVYPPYIYLVVLLALFAIGFATLFERHRQFRRFASVLVAGVLGAVLLFETPLAFKGLQRIRLFWALPFAFVVGIGIDSLKQANRSKVVSAGLVGLLVVAGATGPMAAADDHGSFSQHPEKQVAYDEREYQQMAASASFASEYGNEPTGLWIGAETLVMFGTPASESLTVDRSGIGADSGLFLYRTQWTDHKVFYSVSQRDLSVFYISEAYLDQAVANEHKVYSTDGVGFTWGADRRTVSAQQ